MRQQLLARMPARRVADMMEWGPAKTPQEQFDLLLSREVTPQSLIAPAPGTPALQDDRPINEYYRLRAIFPGKGLWSGPRTVRFFKTADRQCLVFCLQAIRQAGSVNFVALPERQCLLL